MIPNLKFSSRWNQRKGQIICKLDMQCFTTIRLAQSKYEVGERYNIVLTNKKGEVIAEFGTAEVVAINQFHLKNLSEGMARVDTGYSKAETEQIIRRMYPKVNFEEQALVILFLNYVESIENQ
jgi:hypothetical protein